MVVLLDLDLDHDSDDDDPSHQLDIALYQQLRGLQRLGINQSVPGTGLEYRHGFPSNRPPNTASAGLFASALACYPIALSLAARLDLNDLFALSSTCHEVRNCLVQFAHHLRVASLRCVNDSTRSSSHTLSTIEPFSKSHDQSFEEQDHMVGNIEDWLADPMASASNAHYYHGGHSSALGLTGRVGKCARDLVAPCRKCGIVVCRNCAIKPPTARWLPDRYRRLCKTCLDAPLSSHLAGLPDTPECHDSPPASRASSSRSTRSYSAGSNLSHVSGNEVEAAPGSFTTAAFLRTPCECDSRGVYLCQPCGQNLCSANTTYKRVWTWRSRYSTHIGGGLGTGLGQGEQGQKCGRGNHCLEKGATGVCWMEIECSEARAADSYRLEHFGSSYNAPSTILELETESIRNMPGYFSQEMEGIGGVVKKKVRKRIKVGATVYEFDDERESGKYLERESSGQHRSWCGWCFRVCPGSADLPAVKQMIS